MSANEPFLVTPSCVNCHFLMKWDRTIPHGAGSPSSPQEFVDFVSAEERVALGEDGGLKAFGNDTGMIGSYSVACYRKVWDSANFRKDASRDIQILVTRNRRESCFFYPYTPGIYFPAATELELREADRREAGKDRKLTRCAFLVAIVALAVSILATLAGLGWDYWKYYHPLDARPTSAATHVPSPVQQPVPSPAVTPVPSPVQQPAPPSAP